MSDNESLADAAKRKAREGGFAGELKRPATQTDSEEQSGDIEDCGAYAYLRGRQERAQHLELRLKKQSWPAPGYPWLLKPVFDPDGVITLQYASGDQVIIRGRNLRPIFERILRHQVLWIAEQGPEWRSRGSDHLTVVYEIKYQDGHDEQ